jgi:hypothetical protein
MKLMECKLKRLKWKLDKRRMTAKLDKEMHLEMKLFHHHHRQRDRL